MPCGAADRDLVVRLAAVLRVAIGLDRSHRNRVASTSVTCDDDTITVVLHPAGEAPVDLELHAAELRSGLLEEATGRTVEIRVAEPRS